MPSILNLKFKGNKSFVAFSNLNDTESLTKTWKVCTKVASYLEQGQRLENLSWRLWHLQNLIVDTDNAKSKREFKKLSKCMGDKLDKEKGRSIEELEAPDFRRTHSTDILQQRAVEKERNREASQNAQPGTIKRMQFTFSIDQPTPAMDSHVNKPDFKPSSEFLKRPRGGARTHVDDVDRMVVVDDDANDKDPPLTHRGRKPLPQCSFPSPPSPEVPTLRFPSLFSNDFGPSALLFPAPSLTTSMNYGEGHNPSAFNDGFSIMRPTIELPLDELLNNVDTDGDNDSYGEHSSTRSDPQPAEEEDDLNELEYHSEDVIMQPVPISTYNPALNDHDSSDDSSHESDDDDSDADLMSTSTLSSVSPLSGEDIPKTVSPFRVNMALYGNRARANTPTGRPLLTVKTQVGSNNRAAGPGATATSLNPALLRNNGGGTTPTNSNSAPGGVKAECTNCGATHTPLWRRGLNDELNCNACGLYCKLHKRPRPKTMRNTHGEGRTQAAPRQEAVDVMAKCYNCHTTATPLWRKDDEGKTVCNACGLYYKLHGSARPISMKSDVIRKRSRHDARRAANGSLVETLSASPGVSRRASPAREASPTLAPDSTTQMSYDYSEDAEYHGNQATPSELMGALGGQEINHSNFYHSMFNPQFQFPGPYHPEHLQQFAAASEALPFPSGEFDFDQPAMSPRIKKRRRMSTDSASEPPSSAVSYSSFTDGYSTTSSTASHSQRSSMDFPFSNFPALSYLSGPVFRGSGNAFWHPPMMLQNENSPHLFHPPMLPPAEESPMDFLHPPMFPQDDDHLFSTYLHPPMSIPENSPSNSMQNNMGGTQQQSSMMYQGHNEYMGSHEYDNNMRVY